MLVEGIVKGAGPLVAKEVRQVELWLCKPEPTARSLHTMTYSGPHC